MEQFESMLSPIIDQTLGQGSTSMIGYQLSLTLRPPVHTNALISNAFSLSAVLKSLVLPWSAVEEMFSCVSSLMALRLVSELHVRRVG